VCFSLRPKTDRNIERKKNDLVLNRLLFAMAAKNQEGMLSSITTRGMEGRREEGGRTTLFFLTYP